VTHHTSAAPSGFDRWAAQALALTRRFNLVVDANWPRPAAPRPDDDTDVEALAVTLNLLPSPAGPQFPPRRETA
jgi:hypothetical protein